MEDEVSDGYRLADGKSLFEQEWVSLRLYFSEKVRIEPVRGRYPDEGLSHEKRKWRAKYCGLPYLISLVTRFVSRLAHRVRKNQGWTSKTTANITPHLTTVITLIKRYTARDTKLYSPQRSSQISGILLALLKSAVI